MARRRAGTTAITGRPSLARVWLDFRDLFGIVWTRRIQERFNDEMRRRNLSVRLAIEGLEGAGGASLSSVSTADRESADAFLRWLLQKFVDPEWIEARGEEEGPGIRDRGPG
jgi:hypothetical protein